MNNQCSSDEIKTIETLYKPYIETFSHRMVKTLKSHGLINTDDKSELFIFSSSYAERLANMKTIWTMDNALFFNYQDVIEEESGNAFSYDMAKVIQEYILSKKPKIIFLCCDAGESRSAGIAAALYRLYGYDENLIWESAFVRPNSLCYKRMCEVLGIFNQVDFERFVCMNESAFHNAVTSCYHITREMYRYGINSRVGDERKREYFRILKETNSILNMDASKYYDNNELATSVALPLIREVVEQSIEYRWKCKSRLEFDK